MSYLAYLPFGIIPSIIWLAFYLRKDRNPEPKLMILKIFFYGMASALPAIILELGIREELLKLQLPDFLFLVIYFFLGVAFVEETLKYLVVREKTVGNPELDEPIDVMLYMIISALGFAASENILNLSRIEAVDLVPSTVFMVLVIRFVGATFLHALASGLVGYFLAISFYNIKRRDAFIIIGLGSATILHGIYNFSIIKASGPSGLIFPFLVLAGLAVFVFSAFNKLKNLKSVCLIKIKDEK